eukprot:298643-Prymnesium_polylepis.2
MPAPPSRPGVRRLVPPCMPRRTVRLQRRARGRRVRSVWACCAACLAPADVLAHQLQQKERHAPHVRRRAVEVISWQMVLLSAARRAARRSRGWRGGRAGGEAVAVKGGERGEGGERSMGNGLRGRGNAGACRCVPARAPTGFTICTCRGPRASRALGAKGSCLGGPWRGGAKGSCLGGPWRGGGWGSRLSARPRACGSALACASPRARARCLRLRLELEPAQLELRLREPRVAVVVETDQRLRGRDEQVGAPVEAVLVDRLRGRAAALPTAAALSGTGARAPMRRPRRVGASAAGAA